MSEFDKEAEREKLRKKYEEDEADREVTQRMSELLLQGATMTNQHCDTCGSPIFRYEGQSFCPTCQGEADSQAAGGQQAASQQTGEANQPTRTAQNQQPRADETGGESETGTQASADDAQTAPAQRPTAGERASGANATRRSESQSDDLSAARDALVRKLTQLAREAEQTTDVNRTRDLLAATTEAAEALAALDRADR